MNTNRHEVGRRQGGQPYITFGYHRRPPAMPRARRPDLRAAAPASDPGKEYAKVPLPNALDADDTFRAICWIVIIFDDSYDMQRAIFHALEHGRDQLRFIL